MAAKPNIPVSRKEMYLDVATGGSTELPSPVTREEKYLAKIAGESVGIPTPVTRYEMLLAAVAGESYTLTPVTRLEVYLAKAAGQDVEVPQPITREEMYWFDYVSGQPAPSEREYTGAVPVTFIADGTPLLDYLINGNTVQSGTPTPENPIMPQGTGDKTANLCPPLTEWVDGYVTSNGNIAAPSETYKEKSSDYILIGAGKAYTFSMENGFPGGENYSWRAIGWYAQDKTFISRASSNSNVALSTNAPSNAVYCRLSYRTHGETTNSILNEGSTALPYEPFGVKIPISSASTTSPVYLGETQSTRRIKKLVLTGEENITFASEDANRVSVAFTIPNMGMKTSEIGYCNILQWKKKYSQSDYNRIAVATSVVFYMSLEKLILPEPTFDGFISYLKHQYATGTPVTVWYVLATPETAVVNEPLRKIGDYTDSISMEQAGVEIPTVNGSNTLDVDTTVKPSEVYIKYKGYPVAGSQTSLQSSAYAPAEVSSQSESIDDINSSLLGKDEET